MNKFPFVGGVLIGSVLVGLALAIPLGFETSADETHAPPRVAVIDLGSVLAGMTRVEQIEGAIMKEFEDKRAELTQRHSELEGIKGEMAMVKSGSEMYQSLEKKLVFKQAELELDQKKFLEGMERKRAGQLNDFVEQIRSVTQAFAAERDIDLVLEKTLPTQPGALPWDLVFVADDRLIITDEIIEILNKKQ